MSMRLFGDVLPFIGMRKRDAFESYDMGLDLPPVGFMWKTFEVEWFGFGLVIFGKQIPE